MGIPNLYVLDLFFLNISRRSPLIALGITTAKCSVSWEMRYHFGVIRRVKFDQSTTACVVAALCAGVT